MNFLTSMVITGIVATIVADVWGFARKPLLGVAPPDYRMVGRWIARMAHGKFRHDSIAAATPVSGEFLLGWVVHYLIGIAYAAILLGVQGSTWLERPTLWPAMAVGIGTVAAPFLLMQPAMGAGIAASRTPNPAAARLHSFVMHVVFGAGLYAGGWVAHFLTSI